MPDLVLLVDREARDGRKLLSVGLGSEHIGIEDCAVPQRDLHVLLDNQLGIMWLRGAGGLSVHFSPPDETEMIRTHLRVFNIRKGEEGCQEKSNARYDNILIFSEEWTKEAGTIKRFAVHWYSLAPPQFIKYVHPSQ